MATRAPAEIGMPLEEVDTPALLVELDALERNLHTMAEAVAATGVRLRPHAKTHKSPELAARQVALGAIGVCCQKVSEAEAMVEGGVADVLVSNEVVGAPKLRRLAALAGRARIGVCVDDAENLRAVSEAAREAGATLQVLVEVNVGADRCGVEPGEPTLALAREVMAAPSLEFGGLQAYHGAAQHIRDFAERRQAARSAAEKAAWSKSLLEKAGFPCPIVAGGGTGTFAFDAESGVFTELQVGSYLFMDADYARNLDEAGRPAQPFAHSLFVYTTVMSSPVQGRAIVDAGLKALSVDSGMPLVEGHEGVVYERASDEHGKLALAGGKLQVGEKVRLIPGHCDPTVNLHDWYVGVRGGRVEALWPITGRGAIL